MRLTILALLALVLTPAVALSDHWEHLWGGGTAATMEAWKECLENPTEAVCALASGTYNLTNTPDLDGDTYAFTVNLKAGIYKQILCDPGAFITMSGTALAHNMVKINGSTGHGWMEIRGCTFGVTGYGDALYVAGDPGRQRLINVNAWNGVTNVLVSGNSLKEAGDSCTTNSITDSAVGLDLVADGVKVGDEVSITAGATAGTSSTAGRSRPSRLTRSPGALFWRFRLHSTAEQRETPSTVWTM
jgi:hypothetical protein